MLRNNFKNEKYMACVLVNYDWIMFDALHKIAKDKERKRKKNQQENWQNFAKVKI